MNAELLQNFYTGLETLMRERRQLLARRMLAVKPETLVAAFPLTPALSLGERENRSPVALVSDALPRSPDRLNELPPRLPVPTVRLRRPGDEAGDTRITRSRESLFPLPWGEGQGEGKATVQQLKLARKPESLPS